MQEVLELMLEVKNSQMEAHLMNGAVEAIVQAA